MSADTGQHQPWEDLPEVGAGRCPCGAPLVALWRNGATVCVATSALVEHRNSFSDCQRLERAAGAKPRMDQVCECSELDVARARRKYSAALAEVTP